MQYVVVLLDKTKRAIFKQVQAIAYAEGPL